MLRLNRISSYCVVLLLLAGFLLIFETQQSPCKNSKCTYRISRLMENEYLMVKNIMHNLVINHWNITIEYVNFYLEKNYRDCDQYFDFVGVIQPQQKDFRHPNALFRNMNHTTVNKTIKSQYEIEWYEKYKLINYRLQPKNHLQQCNNIGLKLFLLMFDYPNQKYKILKCNSKLNQEDTITTLVDYYIAQSFLKDCTGNLELIAKSVYKLMKYDCERTHTFKVVYFNSKYLNQFRACDANLTVKDLVDDPKISNCSNGQINGLLNKKYCSWFEVVCKYPTTCLKSLGWIEN
jgi:hypothetical protein